MITLFAVELRRLIARRLVWILGLLVLAAIVVGATIAFFQTRNSANTAPAVGVSSQVAVPAAEVRRCMSGRFGPVPEDRAEARRQCIQDLSFAEPDPRFRLTDISDVLLGTSVPLIILVWLVGASYVGAEWHTGTMTTLLTWESRRIRLFAVKLLAAVTFGFVAALLFQALVGASLVPSAVANGITAGADTQWFEDLSAQGLRIATVAGVSAAIGFSIASIGRNTAAALGIGFAYLAIVENLLRALRPHWQPWFFGDNAAAFITASGNTLPELGHNTTEAGLVLVGYALALAVAAAVIFRRRDVT